MEKLLGKKRVRIALGKKTEKKKFWPGVKRKKIKIRRKIRKRNRNSCLKLGTLPYLQLGGICSTGK